jgi:hypothetical protein
MELEERIGRLKTKHLKKLEQAARTGDTAAIVRSAAIVEQIESLHKQIAEAKNSLLALEHDQLVPPMTRQRSDAIGVERAAFTKVAENISSQTLGAKLLGKKRRLDFLGYAREKGVSLVLDRGIRYRKGNKLVGIASASERISNRWFLGLPSDNYAAIVLLCEPKNANGSCVRFILGRELYSSIEKLLTKDVNGQLKVNVSKEYQNYFLKVPRREEINIDSCIDSFESLRLL